MRQKQFRGLGQLGVRGWRQNASHDVNRFIPAGLTPFQKLFPNDITIQIRPVNFNPNID
jgi:hypothetical protein